MLQLIARRVGVPGRRDRVPLIGVIAPPIIKAREEQP